MQITMQDLLEAGCHFGHRTQKWNPKMKKFIYGAKAGIHIIDLEQTAHALNRALGAVKKAVSEGQTLLFVSTKSQTANILPEKALACGMPYVSTRWLGGLLTNFSTVKRRIKHYRDLEEARDTGALEKYTKKEVILFERELAKLDKLFHGVKELRALPDMIFVADPLRDQLAVKEANILGIPVVAICDTNSDPSQIDYPIPANDDAIKSLELLLGLVSAVVSENFKPRAKKENRPENAPAAAPKAPAKVEIKAADLQAKEEGEAPAPEKKTIRKKPAAKKASK